MACHFSISSFLPEPVFAFGSSPSPSKTCPILFSSPHRGENWSFLDGHSSAFESSVFDGSKSLAAVISCSDNCFRSNPSGCSIGSRSAARLLAGCRRSGKSLHSSTRVCCSSSTATSIPEAFGVTESGRFSISDDDLQSRGFQVYRSAEDIDLDQLNSLFVKVGFPRRQKDKLERALQHTSSLRWLQEVKTGKLIAFARATGDDVFNAIIWDVVVDPSYQGLGLGKVVMERLMVDLVRKGISNISLYAEPNVVGFYKPVGFIADPDGIRAMAYSRRGR